jgi:hypothetical protein
MCCSASNCLHIFCYCLCCWVLVLMHCDQIECMGLFLFLYISWDLLCALRYDQFWRRFHGLLRRIYIVQNLDEIFSRHQLGPFDLWCDLVLEFLYWFLFGWPIYWWWGVLKSPTTTVLESMYAFRSFRVCWNWVNWCWVHIGWSLLFPFGVFLLLLVWNVLVYLVWSM